MTRPGPYVSARRDLDLDVIRGIAILLAMGWHFNDITGIPGVDQLLAPGREIGWAGVDLFFVLSGFLIGSLVLREVQQWGSFDAKQFLGRRALRLWPVLYVYLVAQLLIGQHPWTSYLWQNLVHVQNYAGTPLAQMWSLAVEEHFYLALALLIPLWVRRSRNPQTLALILAALLIVPAVLRAVAVSSGADPIVVQSQTHFRVDALAAGVLLAVLRVHYPHHFEALLAYRPIWAVITIAGCTFLWNVPKDSDAGQTAGFTFAWVTSAAFLLLLRGASIVHRARPVSAALATLGVNAYALYIWHASCAGIVTRVLERQGLEPPTLLTVMLKYGAAIVVAVAVSRAVERPGLALRERFFPRRITAAATAVPKDIDLTSASEAAPTTS